MNIELLFNKTRIDVSVRYSVKAKRVLIKIKPDYVELVLPRYANIKQAKDFLYSKREWIVERVKSKPDSKATEIIIFGESYKIIRCDQNRITLHDTSIYIPNGALKVEVIRFLHKKLMELITILVDKFCRLLNLKCNRVSIKNMQTRWGSCSSKKNLSLAFHLVYAPIYIVEYIVAHEVSHLVEMNHSPKFWCIVKSIYPDYDLAQKWLKVNSCVLYYDFILEKCGEMLK